MTGPGGIFERHHRQAVLEQRAQAQAALWIMARLGEVDEPELAEALAKLASRLADGVLLVKAGKAAP